MNMWSVKKLGKGVTSATSPSTEESKPFTSAFRRSSVGAGCDERFLDFPDKAKSDSESAKLTRLDKSFRQLSLLKSLAGSEVGEVEKISKITSASTVEGLLPGHFSSKSLKSMTLRAGGLFDDWNA